MQVSRGFWSWRDWFARMVFDFFMGFTMILPVVEVSLLNNSDGFGKVSLFSDPTGSRRHLPWTCMFMYTLHYINTSQELTTDFIAECHFTEDGSCPCWGLALEAFGCLSSTLQISCPESMLAMYLWNLPNAINHCFLLKNVWHRPQIDDTYTVLYIYIYSYIHI